MSDTEARLHALTNRFLLRCAEDLAKLEAVIADPAASDPEALRYLVHRLSGAAGTFGFAKLSEIAGRADDAMVEGAAYPEAAIAEVVAELRRTLDAVPG